MTHSISEAAAKLDAAMASMNEGRRRTFHISVEQRDPNLSTIEGLHTFLVTRFGSHVASQLHLIDRALALDTCALLTRFDPVFDHPRPARDRVEAIGQIWLDAFESSVSLFSTFPHKKLPKLPSALAIGATSVLHTDIEIGIFAVDSERVGMFVVAENS